MHAIHWSIAAYLIIGIGIENYSLSNDSSSPNPITQQEALVKHEVTNTQTDNAQATFIAMNERKDTLLKVEVKHILISARKSVTSSPCAKREKLQTPDPVISKWKYRKYLKENLIHPTDEGCKDVKGEVVISFFVDKYGNPQRFAIIKSLCASADKEAIRLIKEGSKWNTSILPVKVKVKF